MAANLREGPDFAEEFAAFSSALTLDAMPPEAVEAVLTDIFDTLSCAIAGITANGVQDLVDIVTGWGGAPQAQIWCTGTKVPAHHAAWVNGMMSHARDFDDTHDAAVLHAGVSVVPAAIAAAELAGASGADLIAGVAAGLELISRLGVSTTLGIISTGYMYTSLYGHFAATAAAARAMRLDAQQTMNALGIAYSQAAGNHQVTRDAALTKRMQPGFAAKTGLLSAQLSLKGIRGAQRSFEGADGLFRTYLHGNYDGDRLRDGLGERFDFQALSFKPYPCCRFNHTAIEAALALRKQLAGKPLASIRRIEARVTAQSHQAVGTPIEIRQAPATVVQAQFSIPYTVATALVKGSVGLPDFTDQGLHAPDVRALAARIDVTVDPEIEHIWGRGMSPTLLVAETELGVIETRVDRPKGDSVTPMTRDDFDRKLAGCLAISGLDWPEGASTNLRAVLDGLAKARDIAALTACMVAPG